MSRSTFCGDTRAVAPVIGFILTVGMLILLLAMYQAQVVPQQNAETEFEHHEDIQNELRSLHSAISAVSEDEQPRFHSIRLGTTYQGRTLGVNPAPPAGTIRTEQHNISITNESGAGSTTEIPTQFIEYQPGYNELSVGSTWYEHSVLYLDERERGNSLSVLEDQALVEDGNVTIVALQNEFQETRTGRVTFELYPASGTNESALPEPNGTYIVKIPTRLNESDYWGDALAGEDVYDGFENYNEKDGVYHLKLNVSQDNLDIGKVGIRKESEALRGSEQSNDGDGPRRVLDGDPTPIEHDDVNGESFPDEKLIIPEGEDFVPESDPDGDDRDDAIEYEFKEYQIDGNLETNESVELTSTDGDINIGSTGSTVSGKQFDFYANGDIIVDGATLKTDAGSTGAGNERMTLEATGNISAIDATLDATTEIELIANEFIDLTDAEIIVRDADEEGTGGGGPADVEVTANNIVINNTSFVNSDGEEIDRDLNGNVVDTRP